MQQNEITIGADPEVFILDENKNIASAIGVIGGTKLNPKPTDYGYVQEDNVLAEFNVRPANNGTDFVQNNILAYRNLEDIVTEQGYMIAEGISYYQYSEDEAKVYLNNDQAQTFGCDPDINAWTCEYNENVSAQALAEHIRVAGGHIHIGMPSQYQHPMFSVNLARLCDVFIGAPLYLFAPEEYKIQELKRRNFYGQFGSFREKPYGIEYRAPSNSWLGSTNLMSFVFEASSRAAEIVGRYNAEAEQEIDRFDNLKAIQTMSECLEFEDTSPLKRHIEHICDKYDLPRITHGTFGSIFND